MIRFLAGFALVAFGATASPAFAADTETPTAGPTEASIVCRVAQAGEKVSARMIDSDTSLICKSIDSKVALRMIGKVKTASVRQMGPDLTGTVTTGQMEAAWRDYLNGMFTISAGP